MVDLRSLTPAAQRLFNDIAAFEAQLGLSIDSALQPWDRDRDESIAHMRSLRDQIVRSEVLTVYTFVDELLSLELRRHFFGSPPRVGRRAPRMRTLNRILANLYPLQKLELVEGYRDVPKKICATIRALNQTRNVFAHSFFFQDLRGRRTLYKSMDIFTPAGMAQFHEEIDEVEKYLAPHITRAISEHYAPAVDGES